MNNINKVIWRYRYNMNNKLTYTISIAPLVLTVLPILLFLKHEIDMLNTSLSLSGLIVVSGMGWLICFLNGLDKGDMKCYI